MITGHYVAMGLAVAVLSGNVATAWAEGNAVATVATHPANGHLLWQIGKPDHANAEFALAPNGFRQFTDDAFFVIGVSDPKRDWPYVQPGPADGWAGPRRQHTFTIVFGIKQPGKGDCELKVDLLDTPKALPPRVVVEVNGQTFYGQSFNRQLPAGSGNDPLEGSFAKGKPHTLAIGFPSSFLTVGKNVISITTIAGSWMLYDHVTLETTANMELVPVEQASQIMPGETCNDIKLTVFFDKVINTMRGGIGASWHAVEYPIPFGNRGSVWGGYPPAEDDAAWAQIYRHASWLGLDWNRVELEARMYEPERGQFTWDNPEMRILYRILDWNEKHKADVFLQHQHMNVKWNSYPEWGDNPNVYVHSAPKDEQAFADGLATLVEHLVKEKHYTCIRWLSLANEPPGWWRIPPKPGLPKDAPMQSLYRTVALVRKALDDRGLANIPISGMDRTASFPAYTPQLYPISDKLGAYDFHFYNDSFDFRSNGALARSVNTTLGWTAGAHQAGKAFFISEFGTMANGWNGFPDGPACYESVLNDAEFVVRRINAGVDGLNRWSFVNRGDQDGNWQFIETFDRKEKKMLKDYCPRANTYYLLGLLPRFIAKHSDVLACDISGGKIGEWQRVFAMALRSPKGSLTFAVVNDAPNEFTLRVDLRNPGPAREMYRYSTTLGERDRADLRIHPQKTVAIGENAATFVDRIEPLSLTIFSTYKLGDTDDGIITEGPYE